MRKSVVAFLLAIFAVAGTAFADDQFVVRVDTRIGFNGLFKPGRWTPVELTLQNLGADARGTLIVELTRRDRMGPERHTTSYQRTLDLASGAIKNFSLVLPLETAVYPLEVQITHDGVTVIEEEVKLTGRSASNAMVAVLSRRPALDFLLPVFNSQTERSLEIVYPLVDYLPDRWEGYDGLDLIVMHDARIQSLSPAQVDAIRGWVAAGGRMIVSAGAHLGPADAAVLEELTGLTVDSVDVATVDQLGFGDVGLPVHPDEREAVAVVSQFANAPPVVSTMRLGRGEIVVLPFDYTQLVRVAPATSLGMWTTMLPRIAVLGDSAPDDETVFGTSQLAGSTIEAGRRSGLIPISMSRRAFETDLLANQLDLPAYNFPSRLLVAGLTLSFLAIALGLLYWAANRETPKGSIAGVVLLVALAGLTSAVAHLTLTVGQQPPEALSFSLEIAEMGPDDGYAMVTKDVLLFSRQRADYTVEFSGSPVIVPVEYRGQQVQHSGPVKELNLSVNRWGHENTVVMQIAELDIRSRTQRGIGYANVELHNRSAVGLENVVILNDGFPGQVGNLVPGEVVEHVVMGAGVGSWEEIEWETFVPTGSLAEHQAQLLQDLARQQRINDDETPGSLLVVGWRPESLIESRVEPAFFRHIELNALVMHIDSGAGLQGGTE